jgi:hypothetical protein
MGAGRAVPDNYLKITIDGVLIYDAIFGDFRTTAHVSSVEILPVRNLVHIRVACQVYSPNLHWVAGGDTHFFYGEPYGEAYFVCDIDWLWAQVQPDPTPPPDSDSMAAMAELVSLVENALVDPESLSERRLRESERRLEDCRQNCRHLWKELKSLERWVALKQLDAETGGCLLPIR